MITATPSPLPVLPSNGPADWAGIPLGTMTNHPDGVVKPLYGGDVLGIQNRQDFQRCSSTELLGAVREAARIAGSGGSGKYAIGVLQASDGAFYTTPMHTGPRGAFIWFFEITSATSNLAAFKAIVGPTSWIRFPEAPAGSTPQAAPSQAIAS